MSTALSIEKDIHTAPFRVSTSPNDSFHSVLLQACAHFQLDPTGYSLVHAATQARLDLNLPIRLANLPHGAKLKLVPVKQKVAGNVTIKLQVVAPDESFKLQRNTAIGTFPATISLLDMLQHFEGSTDIKSNTQIIGGKLLGVSGVRYIQTTNKLNKRLKIKSKVKVQWKPILQLLNKTLEYNEKEWRRLSLADLGLSSGQHLMRLRFEPLELGEPTVVEESEPEPVLKPEPKQEQPSSLPSASSSASDIEVFRHHNGSGNRHIDEPSYEVTVDDAKLYQSILSKRAETAHLHPKRQEFLNNNKKIQRQQQLTACKIRIKFPDSNTVQLTMDPNQPLLELFNVVANEILLDSLDAKTPWFELYIAHPLTIILGPSTDLNLSLVEAGIDARTSLSFKLANPKAQQPKQYIKDKYLLNARPTTEMDEFKSTSSEEPKLQPAPVQLPPPAPEQSTKQKKLPKWLRLSKK